MNKQFTESKPRNLEWLAWLNGCLLYDGGLCVERENPKEGVYIRAKSLELRCDVILLIGEK